MNFIPISYYYTWLIHEDMSIEQTLWHIRQAFREGQISLIEYQRLFNHVKSIEKENFGE